MKRIFRITACVIAAIAFLLITSCSSSTKPNKVASPILTPAGGLYNQAQQISITCATTDAEIRYTLDGSTPPVNSFIYSTPITVPLGTTVKAYAIKPGMEDSNVVTHFYSGIVPTPVLEPESGTFVPGFYARIKINGLSSATSWPDGVSVRYTLNGTEPDSTSLLYSMPFQVNEAVILKAKAYRYNWTPSPVVSAAYSIPSVLNLIGTTSAGGTAYDLEISGNYAYAAVMGAGLRIYDISNPSNLVLVGTFAVSGEVSKLELVGQHIYLARGGEIRVINVQNPAVPQQVASFTVSGSEVISMAHSGNILYMGLSSNYVLATDIANPSAPQPIGSYLLQEVAYGLAAKDNYVYAAAGKTGMAIINFSIAAYPEFAANCQIQGFCSDISVRGNYAYVTDYLEGVQIINISNPAAPVIAGVYTASDNCFSVLAAENGFVYAYEYGTGLLKLNVNNPAAPLLVAYLNLSGLVSKINYGNNYLFLTNFSSGIQVLEP